MPSGRERKYRAAYTPEIAAKKTQATGTVQTIIDALTGRPAGGNEGDDDTQTGLLVAEGRWERVNRQLRAERAGRMRS